MDYGRTIIQTLRACQNYGYEQAKIALQEDTYISPRQLFEDVKHKMPKEIYNYNQFKIGVLRAIEQRHTTNEKEKILKETIESALRELES